MRYLLLAFLLGCAPAPAPPPPPSPSPSPPATPAATPAAPTTAQTTPPLAASPPDAAAPDAGPSPEEKALVAALRKNHAALVACHRASKNATGDMTLRVTIGVNGKVEALSVQQPSTVPRALEDCILTRVREARVEATPVTIPLPFRFRTSPYDGPTISYGNGPFDPGY